MCECHLKSITSPKMRHALQNTTATNHRQAEILTATKFRLSSEAKHALSRPIGSFSSTHCAPWLIGQKLHCVCSQSAVGQLKFILYYTYKCAPLILCHVKCHTYFIRVQYVFMTIYCILQNIHYIIIIVNLNCINDIQNLWRNK